MAPSCRSSRGSRWEVITLLGERFKRIPSPPPGRSCLPFLPTADSRTPCLPGHGGGVWRIPVDDDHLVFAWNWFPVGIELERVLDEVRGGVRRKELNSYFNELAQPQPPAEMAGCLLASGSCLEWGIRSPSPLQERNRKPFFWFPGSLKLLTFYQTSQKNFQIALPDVRTS